MFALTIKGNTLSELYDNLESAIRYGRPSPADTPVNPTLPVSSGTTPAQTVHTPDASTQSAIAGSHVPVTTSVVPTTAQETATPVSTSFDSPAPPVPAAAAPVYTLEQLARAGASLAQAGKVDQAQALLARYDIRSISQLPPVHYGAFATELRALGAQI